MTERETFDRVIGILRSHVADEAALAAVSLDTHIVEDLNLTSTHLVEVVLAFEDEFEIELADDDVDAVSTVGDAVRLITAKTG